MRPARVGGNGKQRPAQASVPAQKSVPAKDVGDNGKQRPK